MSRLVPDGKGGTDGGRGGTAATAPNDSNGDSISRVGGL